MLTFFSTRMFTFLARAAASTVEKEDGNEQTAIALREFKQRVSQKCTKVINITRQEKRESEEWGEREEVQQT